MIKFEGFEQLETLGYFPEGNEKELIKMAMKDNGNVYFSDNGIVAIFVTVNENGEEFDLVNVEKK